MPWVHVLWCGLFPALRVQDGNTIAARAAQSLQIFNLELGKKVKSHKMPDDKVVQYWTWITPNTIGLITDTEVFHWSIDGACTAKSGRRLAFRGLQGLAARRWRRRRATAPCPHRRRRAKFSAGKVC